MKSFRVLTARKSALFTAFSWKHDAGMHRWMIKLATHKNHELVLTVLVISVT